MAVHVHCAFLRNTWTSACTPFSHFIRWAVLSSPVVRLPVTPECVCLFFFYVRWHVCHKQAAYSVNPLSLFSRSANECVLKLNWTYRSSQGQPHHTPIEYPHTWWRHERTRFLERFTVKGFGCATSHLKPVKTHLAITSEETGDQIDTLCSSCRLMCVYIPSVSE